MSRPSARKEWDKPLRFGDGRGAPESEFAAKPAPEPETHSYTLVYETRGALSRGRLTLPDGTTEQTEWRVYDHGMVAAVHSLLQKWRRAGILGGMGRAPRGVARTGR